MKSSAKPSKTSRPTYITKPLAWRGQPFVFKNLIELKNARRVEIANNVLENNWHAAQTGFAVLFTVRNQEGGCAWCQVREVVFEHNVVRHRRRAPASAQNGAPE